LVLKYFVIKDSFGDKRMEIVFKPVQTEKLRDE
jgi:hypothetical protein